MRFANSPILWIIAGLLVAAAIYGLRAWLALRDVRADADTDYAYRQTHRMLGSDLAPERFRDTYLRANFPRRQAYMAGTLLALAVLTFPFLRVADLIWKGVWRLSGEARTFEPTFLVYQFGIFFSMIALWSLVGFIAARRYHKAEDLTLDEALRREVGR